MLIGLLPAILCMILCVFFLDAYVIYGCTLLCVIYFFIAKIRKFQVWPNIIFMHTFIALSICAIVKLTTGNFLIPDKSVPLTLEVLIFCSSLLYIAFPDIYKKINKFVYYKISILNQMGCQLIVIFSMAYMFLACIIYLFLGPIDLDHLYWLTHIIPPIVYILCIIANYFTIKSVYKNYDRLPLLRVIAINDGNILISKRLLSCYQKNRLDTPMEDIIFDSTDLTDKARRIYVLSLGISQFDAEPRFSIKYVSKSTLNKDVVLFILPINDIKDIKLSHCKFVSPEEIRKHIDMYSSYMKEEIDHLSVAALIWKNEDISL